MANVAGVTHDISLKVGSGTETGLTLARKDGLKQFSMSAIEVLPPSYMTSAPALENVNPKGGIPLKLFDFRGGFGETYKSAALRYYKTDGADASVPEKVQQSGARVAEFQGAIPNGDMSGHVGTVLNDWVVDSGSVIWSSNAALFGVAGGQIHGILPFTTADRGKSVCIQFTAVVGLIDAMAITIDDGATTTVVTVAAGATVTKAVSHILSATATKCWIIFYRGGTSNTSTVDNVVYTTPTIFCDALGKTFSARGSLLTYWDVTDGWKWSYTAGATIVDMKAYGTDLFISLGAATNGQYSTDGAAFSAIGGAGINSDFMSKVGVNLWFWRKIAGGGPNGRFSTTQVNAEGGTVGAAVAVGDALCDLTGAVDDTRGPTSSIVYAWKTDGLWAYDATSGTFLAVVPELRAVKDSTTGYCSLFWKNDLFGTVGGSRIIRLIGGTVVDDISPKDFAPDQAEFAYTCRALAADTDWVYAILHSGITGTNAWLLKGNVPRGYTEWVWHTVKSWVSDEVYDAIIDRTTTTDTKLFIATYEGVTRFYIDRAQSAFLGDTAGIIWGPREDAGFRTWNKAYQSIDVLLEGAGAGKSLTVEFAKASAPTTWAAIGAGTVTTEGTTRLYFTSSCVETWIQVRITLVGTTTAMPVCKGYVLNSAIRPTLRRTFAFAVDVSPETKKLDGVKETVSVKDRRDYCRTVDESTWYVQLRDPDDVLWYVDFQPIRETLIKSAEVRDGGPAWVVEFRGIEADVA